MDIRDSSKARFSPYRTASMKRRVPGLRDAAPPSDIKVFKLNPDGTKGELVRTEPAFSDKKTRWIPNGGNYVT